MQMPMMHVGIVRVRMDEWLMHVFMRVWLAPVPVEVVRMAVVRVVKMRVRMLLTFVLMEVLVLLGDVQPYAHRHQSARGSQLPS